MLSKRIIRKHKHAYFAPCKREKYKDKEMGNPRNNQSAFMWRRINFAAFVW